MLRTCRLKSQLASFLYRAMFYPFDMNGLIRIALSTCIRQPVVRRFYGIDQKLRTRCSNQGVLHDTTRSTLHVKSQLKLKAGFIDIGHRSMIRWRILKYSPRWDALNINDEYRAHSGGYLQLHQRKGSSGPWQISWIHTWGIILCPSSFFSMPASGASSTKVSFRLHFRHQCSSSR